jgi:hypothetical protein
MHRGEQRIIERHQLWRRRSLTDRPFGKFLERGDEIGVL